MTYKVLYTDPAWAVTPHGVEPRLAEIERDVYGDRVELLFGPYGDGRYELDVPVLGKVAGGCDALVVYRCQVDEDLLNAAGPSLRVVVRQGVGVDNLNAPLLEQRGIVAVNVPDYCVDEVANHTLALALALERHVVVQHNRLVGGTFDIYAGGLPRRLSRLTAGVVGFGRIGRAVARKLSVVYGRVIGCDPYVGPDLLEGYGVEPVTMLELLRRADLVTVHCPLTRETEGMFDVDAFAAMRPGAYFLNCARGRLVRPDALLGALMSGRLAGAGLDVFSPENPHHDADWSHIVASGRVVVSSHRAFLSADAEVSCRRRVANEVLSVLDGGRPLHGLVTS